MFWKKNVFPSAANFSYSVNDDGDAVTLFGTKVLAHNGDPAYGESMFYLSAGLSLGPNRALCYTERPDLCFNLA